MEIARLTKGRWYRPVAGVLLFVVVWQIASRDDSVLLPPLQRVIGAIHQLLVQGIMLGDIGASLWRVMTGVALSAMVAVLLGVVSGLFRPLPEYISGVVELLRPIPPIAWTPVAIIAFGIGDGPAVAIVALGSFFPIWFGVIQGLGEVRQPHLRAAASLGCGRWMLLTDVILPSAIPYMVHGLRLGVGLGWFCVVAAEMMGASSGLGYGVQLFSMNLEMEKLYAYLFAIALVGYLSNTILEHLGRNLGPVRGG